MLYKTSNTIHLRFNIVNSNLPEILAVDSTAQQRYTERAWDRTW